MKNILCALALAIAMTGAAFPQSSANQDVSKIVGSWESLDKENDKPLATVTVKMAGDKLTGVMQLEDIVKDGKKAPEEFSMTDVIFDGKVLSFKLTLQDGNEKAVTDWEFLLRDGNGARLAALKDNNKPVEDGPVFVMKRVKAN